MAGRGWPGDRRRVVTLRISSHAFIRMVCGKQAGRQPGGHDDRGDTRGLTLVPGDGALATLKRESYEHGDRAGAGSVSPDEPAYCLVLFGPGEVLTQTYDEPAVRLHPVLDLPARKDLSCYFRPGKDRHCQRLPLRNP